MIDQIPNRNNLRVVKTARSEEAINKAAKDGFYPLIKVVEPSDEIRNKLMIFQHKKDGTIKIVGDYRAFADLEKDNYEMVNRIEYYPYKFEEPYAAYLIPKDIKKGERVYLEDVIEDIVGAHWNQGDTYRLKSVDAVWTGNDFYIDFDPEEDGMVFIG